jgi:hypothetical protein
MNLNWKVIAIGSLVSLVLVLLLSSIYLAFIGPIIGGIITGYMLIGTRNDVLLNGGISAGFGGGTAGIINIYLTLVLFSSLGFDINSAYPMIMGSIIGAIIIYIFLGAAGALIGQYIKNRKK